ncbi:ABC-2 type transporter [Colletotrichum scovillei]|uniref:ABC-2 type transporter n=1 Tax=Colletotrichum scovillei TaxID=1209932 RepID=A0A9P7UAB2_9PEZI|nr:ABC-2 type transporter [Colletotrichum scovillei]KAG7056890.1 ABC-2 type transporter [Colletotrichum scovillei]KAG7066818.1 ABC-2 type transporter [Colletotrichum scovillei]
MIYVMKNTTTYAQRMPTFLEQYPKDCSIYRSPSIISEPGTAPTTAQVRPDIERSS